MKKINVVLFIILIIIFSKPAFTQKLNFVDEGIKDSSFNNFRTEFLNAVLQKDTAYIISKLDTGVTSGFNQEDGIKKFKKKYLLNDKINIWQILTGVLSLGGRFRGDDNNMFFAPYVYTDWPDTVDAFNYMAVTDDTVHVYDEPCTCTKVIEKLSYEIVKVDINYFNRNLWEIVFTPDGKKGFVESEDIYSPIGYRIGFQKEKGKWKVLFLLSGD